MQSQPASQPVHPAFHNANLSGLVVTGEPIALASRHAKARRDGYGISSASTDLKRGSVAGTSGMSLAGVATRPDP
jgi:hypothetical protein